MSVINLFIYTNLTIGTIHTSNIEALGVQKLLDN